MKKAFIASVIPNLLFMPKPKPHPSSHSEHLDAYLNKFQRALWVIKLSEALLSALIGVLAIFLFVFLLDRLFDTPSLLRFFFLPSWLVLFRGLFTLLPLPVGIFLQTTKANCPFGDAALPFLW